MAQVGLRPWNQRTISCCVVMAPQLTSLSGKGAISFASHSVVSSSAVASHPPWCSTCWRKVWYVQILRGNTLKQMCTHRAAPYSCDMWLISPAAAVGVNVLTLQVCSHSFLLEHCFNSSLLLSGKVGLQHVLVCGLWRGNCSFLRINHQVWGGRVRRLEEVVGQQLL